MRDTLMKKLENQIEISRKKMQDLWNQRGYTDEVVLKASIELDELLNEYQRLSSQNSNLSKITGYPKEGFTPSFSAIMDSQA